MLAEGLWYEWKAKGVDVLACCAGSTDTPNYRNTHPAKPGFFDPRPLSPLQVAEQTIARLGKGPSFVPGPANRVAAFLMRRLISTPSAIRIMGNATRRLYGDDQGIPWR